MVVFNFEKASYAQKLLSGRIRISKLDYVPRYIVGLDVSYIKDYGLGVAVAAEFDSLRVVKVASVVDRVEVPYVPGYLAFREAPVLFKVLRKLKLDLRESILMVNGHGITHPRRFGIASHIGVVLDVPSIGVAKRILSGRVVELDGRSVIVVDNIVGGVVFSRGRHRVYASIGHRVSIDDVVSIVDRCFVGLKPLPYPLYLADKYSRDMARDLKVRLG